MKTKETTRRLGGEIFSYFTKQPELHKIRLTVESLAVDREVSMGPFDPADLLQVWVCLLHIKGYLA